MFCQKHFFVTLTRLFTFSHRDESQKKPTSVVKKMTKLSWNYGGFFVCVRLERNITHQYILPEAILLETSKILSLLSLPATRKSSVHPAQLSVPRASLEVIVF